MRWQRCGEAHCHDVARAGEAQRGEVWTRLITVMWSTSVYHDMAGVVGGECCAQAMLGVLTAEGK